LKDPELGADTTYFRGDHDEVAREMSPGPKKRGTKSWE